LVEGGADQVNEALKQKRKQRQLPKVNQQANDFMKAIRDYAPAVIIIVGVVSGLDSGDDGGGDQSSDQMDDLVDDLENGPEKNPITTIYKAPGVGQGDTLLNKGFHPEDFNTGDKSAYFAKGRKLAEEYADKYGEGVLEVDIPTDIYNERIKQHEVPYLSDPAEIEIPIPQKDFDVLNNAIRRLIDNEELWRWLD